MGDDSLSWLMRRDALIGSLAFASARSHRSSLKQAGVGLAVAVLIDATIIRGVLLPASMTLLGDASWYLPHHLRWLPQLTVDATEPRRLEPASTTRSSM